MFITHFVCDFADSISRGTLYASGCSLFYAGCCLGSGGKFFERNGTRLFHAASRILDGNPGTIKRLIATGAFKITRVCCSSTIKCSNASLKCFEIANKCFHGMHAVDLFFRQGVRNIPLIGKMLDFEKEVFQMRALIS